MYLLVVISVVILVSHNTRWTFRQQENFGALMPYDISSITWATLKLFINFIVYSSFSNISKYNWFSYRIKKHFQWISVVTRYKTVHKCWHGTPRWSLRAITSSVRRVQTVTPPHAIIIYNTRKSDSIIVI